MNIPVIYEDSEVLVLDKPFNLTVTRSETSKEETLEDYLINELNITIDRGGIVHRLDKDTSGAIIVAKTQESLENLQQQFKERIVKKTYICLVHGWIESPGKIEGSIGRNPQNREKFTVLDDGKEAITEYYPDKKLIMSQESIDKVFSDFNKIQLRKMYSLNYQKFTLVKCHPLTGRTHQIRVHLKYINYPIVGDEKYVGRRWVRLDHRWCKRQFLHAFEIEFNHPKTGERLYFKSDMPEDLKLALSFLDKK